MSAPKKFRGYGFTVEDWLAICEMHGHRCASCGEEKPLTVDHIKPRAAGGTDALDNIQPLCKRCNSVKNSVHNGVRVALKTVGRRNMHRERRSSLITWRVKPSYKLMLGEVADATGQHVAELLESAVDFYLSRKDVRDALAKSKPTEEGS